MGRSAAALAGWTDGLRRKATQPPVHSAVAAQSRMLSSCRSSWCGCPGVDVLVWVVLGWVVLDAAWFKRPLGPGCCCSVPDTTKWQAWVPLLPGCPGVGIHTGGPGGCGFQVRMPRRSSYASAVAHPVPSRSPPGTNKAQRPSRGCAICRRRRRRSGRRYWRQACGGRRRR
eukprot:363348-Chlamydomonas_euryale.AAC.20